MFNIIEHVFGFNDFPVVYATIKTEIKKIKSKISFYNIPCAFDIETSSFYDNGEKIGLMYVWQFGFFGYVFMGRQWGELVHLFNDIRTLLNIDLNNRLIVYVHNLSYEFQYIRKIFEWSKVFSIDIRKPIYAITTDGIEFRCSYLLSGYSLEKIGDNLIKYKYTKLTGSLDYELKRHNKTPLTENELRYCFNDVAVLMCYIQEKIEAEGDITKIPLTKTGYVRRFCRNMCLYEGSSHKKGGKKFNKYHNFIKSLSIEVDEYKQLKRAFIGGFTHSNPINTNKVLYNVKSFDFTSSYPFCMISEKYPMSKGRVIEVDNVSFRRYLDRYCCVFDIKFINIRPVIEYENYISLSKCFKCVNPVVNNGRIVTADEIITTITDVDYSIIMKCYEWDSIKIGCFRIYEKDYLPKNFILSIIKLYRDKTQLKGVEGKEVEYMQSKEMLNSCYGMCVTDISRNDFVYADEWKTIKPSDEQIRNDLNKYNNDKKRFLFYPWGVFVTAYARRNLFTGILEFKNDYIYSDTDSIKVINHQNHVYYIENYNVHTQKKLAMACEYHGIDVTELLPKTINGIVKKLGVWDDDGTYETFKTLGAKRYMYKNENGYHITIAGTSKNLGSKYMTNMPKPYKAFNDGLIIPPEYTGKLTHTYIDELREGVLLDYTGKAAEYHEKSSVHLEKCPYKLSLSEQYLDYLLGVRESWK